MLRRLKEMAQSGVKSAQEIAEEYAEGECGELDRKMKCGGSGKQRSKLEQHENKHKDPEVWNFLRF